MKNTLKRIVYLLPIFFLFQTYAQKQPKLQSTLLWEISGNGLQQPSYLFGTYHLAGKSFADSLKIVDRAYHKTKVVISELELDSTAAMQLAAEMMLQDKNLHDFFSEKEYAAIDSFTQRYANMNIAFLNGLKPAAVQMTLLVMITPKDIGPQNPALDEYFQILARKEHKKIIGMETFREQIDLLLGEPEKEQAKKLLAFVKRGEKNIQEAKKLYEAYVRQDLSALSAMMLDNEDYTPEEMNKLVISRNLNWVKKLPAIMTSQSAFIAVGAAHLVGEYGLINQLRNRGYTVKPVTQ